MKPTDDATPEEILPTWDVTELPPPPSEPPSAPSPEPSSEPDAPEAEPEEPGPSPGVTRFVPHVNLMMMLVCAGLLVVAGVAWSNLTLRAADISKQQADLFARKVAQIVGQADRVPKPGTRRTSVSETELNSWFAYSATPLLPAGVAEPRVTLVGNGKLAGKALVDLDAIAKKKQSGGTFDLWNLVGGKVPVNVVGVLHTKDGRGRFEMQSASLSGIPLPKSLLQELVSYYSRTPDRPQGIRMDDAFDLPASIRHIEVGQGQAVVVQ